MFVAVEMLNKIINVRNPPFIANVASVPFDHSLQHLPFRKVIQLRIQSVSICVNVTFSSILAAVPFSDGETIEIILSDDSSLICSWISLLMLVPIDLSGVDNDKDCGSGITIAFVSGRVKLDGRTCAVSFVLSVISAVERAT